ncbi:MAG: ABC transporter ATP-binding protein [Candidatus Bathyarchaeia archaeon]
MLEGSGLTKCFGALTAVKGVSFKVDEKRIIGLIGPNGSGKTTLFNLISGFYKPDSGRITFLGHDITGWPPYRICRLGVSRTYQSVRPFLDMTVLENVMVGSLYGAGVDIRKSRSEALECLRFVGLDRKKDILARNLNICERKFLEIARALATKPKVLMLDEPLSGLNPREIIQAREIIKRIKDDFGISVFWVEHIMRALRGVVERVIVLNYGEKITEGSFEEITKDERVIEAYLGEKWVI